MKPTLLLLCCLINTVCFAKLNIQQWHTQNGTQVLYVHAPDVPMLDIQLAFGAGSAYDGEQFGLASLTTELLTQGSQGKSADQIADMLADSGAQINSNTTRDMSIISLRTLTSPEALSKALTSFELILNHPDFPAQAVKREKNQQIAAIKQSQQSPNSQANQLFFRQLYGTHPYAHPVEGNINTVSTIKPKQIHAFYRKYYVGHNATMAIVGAIDVAQAKAISEQLTHNQAPGKTPPPLAKIKIAASLDKQQLDFHSSQTAIRIGQLGITHHDPDYFPLKVGNYTLGGGALVSRLTHEIREKRGLSYHVSSLFLPLPAVGPFIINLATQSQQTQQAIEVTQQTVTQFVAQGPNKQELKAAKQYLTGSFPLSLATNRAIASKLLSIGFYQMPIDYIDTYVHNINAVSQEQVKHAFLRHVNPQKLLLVTVGSKRPNG